MNRVLALLFVSSALGVVALSQARAASPKDEAEALIKRGNDLRRSGDDQGALPLMQEAFGLDASPRNAVQLGLTEQGLGMWAEADEHLTFGLKAVSDPWIVAHRETIEESLRVVKRRVGRIHITGDPAGAEVLVNGKVVGTLPLGEAIAVSEGSVDVELRAPGHRAGFRTLPIKGGQYQPVVMRLEPGEGPAGGLAAGTLAASDPPPEAGAGKHWQRIATYGAAAGALAGIGLGIYGWLEHDSEVQAFNARDCVVTKAGPVRRPDIPDSRCRALASNYENAKTLSTVGLVAGGALAVTAAILFLTDDRVSDAGERASDRAFVCAPDLHALGMGCMARF